MKTIYFKHLYMMVTLIFVTSCYHPIFSQVGIGTTTPNGILDVSSSIHGVVFPRVALRRTNTATPVVNPNGGSLALGTTVYNTTPTTPPAGATDVYEGFYFWNGSNWIPQFERKDSQKFEQTSVGQRVSSNGLNENITGLASRTFTPDYSGMYKIEVTMDFGGGQLNNPPSGNIHIIPAQAFYRFTFNGTIYQKYINVLSAINALNAAPDNQIVNVYKRPTILLYLPLIAGVDYPFNLAIDQLAGNGYVNNGASGTGRGYVGTNGPCTVEYTYLE